MTDARDAPLRVLAVDDEEEILRFYERTLRSALARSKQDSRMSGLETELFGSPETQSPAPQAFDIVCCRQIDVAVTVTDEAVARKMPFAVAFIDVRLPPGPDGVWAAERIRSLSPETNIVIVTGYADVDPKEIATRVPPADKLIYVRKPIHPPEFRQLVHALGAKWLLERDLRSAKERAESADRAKSVFLANMSYELRTPLSSMLGFTDLLKRQGFGPLSPQQTEFVATIERSGRQLQSLIDGLLDLTKIETGTMDLNLVRADPGDLVRECLEVVQEPAAQKQISLSTQIAGGDSFVVDMQRIKQSLLNLLFNAIKFTDVGGKIGIAATRSETHVTFTVWDSGVGIPTENQKGIFEDSTFAYPMAKKETGLGLSLSRKLIELHGGTIWVESEPGHGSRFFFSIPTDLNPGPGVLPVGGSLDPAGPNQASGQVILIVEDDPDLLKALTLLLETNGYTVETAMNAEDGVQLAGAVRPDLILLDIRLPGPPGTVVLNRIRELPETREIPVFAVTAYALTGDREQLIEQGFDRCFAKPIESQEILREIAQALT